MIPEHRLSTTPQYAPYRYGDSIEPPNDLTDYEMGGIALSDPTQGLEVQLWVAQCDAETGVITLEAPLVTPTVIFTAPGTTEINFCFDQNMRPFFAYVQNGQAKYRWFDTVTGQNEIVSLGATDHSPRCCMDDKRPYQTALGTNDIILAYVRDSNLYFREQRDRLGTEYLLKTGVQGRFLRMGMNRGLRLQFMFEG